MDGADGSASILAVNYLPVLRKLGQPRWRCCTCCKAFRSRLYPETRCRRVRRRRIGMRRLGAWKGFQAWTRMYVDPPAQGSATRG